MLVFFYAVHRIKAKSSTAEVSLTLYPFRLSTTQASSASRPIVTVMFGIGSANRGKLASSGRTNRRAWKYREREKMERKCSMVMCDG